MSRVLFINGNLYGHFNPTLPLVAELVSQGDEVWYYCADLFREQVELAGAAFIPAGKELEDFYHHYKPTDQHPFYTLIEYIIKYDQVLLPDILEQTNKFSYDYIIYDSILGAGYFLKQLVKVPVISSNSSFVMNKLPVPDRMLLEGSHPQLDECYRILRQLCHQWKVNEPEIFDVFSNKGDLNLVYTSREFNPEGDSFDPSYIFLGPSVKERDERMEFPYEVLEGNKVIYISLGTINTNFIGFYKLCMESFGNTEYKVVMSIGNKCSISDLGPIPDNFIVRNFVPQLEVLKRSSVFISHGGFNSVSESLYYGVPLVVLPMVNDQYMVAQRLVQLGAGIMLKMSEITSGLLAQTVEKIVSSPEYGIACRQIGHSFRQAGGCSKAIEEIKKLERKKHGNQE